MKKTLALYATIGTVLLVFPHLFGVIKTNLFVEFMIGSLFAVSLNIILSYTGLLSFGHAMFFGTGAYATALSLTHIKGIPLMAAVLVGGLVPLVLSLVLSPLLVRVRDTAFAMLTMAFGQLTFVLCLKFREVTGGEDGIASYAVPWLKIPGLASIDMGDPFNFYYFALVVVAICVFVTWFFTKTPLGCVMVGIRDNQQRVNYLGFHVAWSKAAIFSISGFFAGIAGGLASMFHGVVSTDGFLTGMVSFYPLMAILVGGIGTFSGPIIGTGVLVLLQEFTLRYTQRAELVWGLVFICVVLYMPGGLADGWTTLKYKWHVWKRKSALPSEKQGVIT